VAWKNGVAIVEKVWPMLQPGLIHGSVPRAFLDEFLALFVKYGTDAEVLNEISPEIRESIKRLGIDIGRIPVDDDGVNGCLKGMRDPLPQVRATSADALAHFVTKAANPERAAHAAFAAIMQILRTDKAIVVRRAAAESMYAIVGEHPLPPQLIAALDKLPEDADPLVEKRLLSIMKKSAKPKKPATPLPDDEED
jgi:hypothetical protein